MEPDDPSLILEGPSLTIDDPSQIESAMCYTIDNRDSILSLLSMVTHGLSYRLSTVDFSCVRTPAALRVIVA